MERLLVVSYPISAADRLAWIQDIRLQYDELNFQAIDPHFTLVFPSKVNRLDLIWDEHDRVGKVEEFSLI